MDKQRLNPFEEMEEQQIRTFFTGPVERKVKASLDGTLGTMRFLGSMADVFITRMVDTMAGIAGKDLARSDDTNATRGAEGRGTPEIGDQQQTKYPNL
ncbi:MAG: hypothetical protein DA408_14680 [Bacteroidetes bacterium]|nr:MAG: hypothetical protein C7N36_11195 [Bacteroidota bacterium]PTM11036.1 MAG: hypothetical protein DA408_14680 [Bacteroidota bacterium]